jgi:hypothetical protein
MTAAQEEAEILRNARGACEAGKITPEQERDVWTMVMIAQAERKVLK